MLEGHRRYLEAYRAACSVRPDVHPCQLAALDREAALAAEAADLDAYLAASGALFELTRAAWLDRLLVHLRVARAVHDPWAAAAVEAEIRHALAAGGADDWAEAIVAGSTEAGDVVGRGARATSAFVRWQLTRIAGFDEVAEQERAELEAADPELDLGAPPYRQRTPWPGGEPGAPEEVGEPPSTLVAGWLAELAKRRGTAPVPYELEDAAAPYRPLAELDGPLADAARAIVEACDGASSPHEAQTVLHERGLLAALAAAPVRATEQERLARRADWPDPLLEAHALDTLERLDGLRTATEVELVSVRAGACVAVEADWNVQLLAALVAPLRGALASGWDPSQRDTVAPAAARSHALTGLGPRALARLPRVASVLLAVASLSAPDADEAFGAVEGEGGLELLHEARLLVQVTGEPLRDAAQRVEQLLDAAGAPEPASEPRPVELWGRRIPLIDLGEALARPDRPQV